MTRGSSKDFLLRTDEGQDSEHHTYIDKMTVQLGNKVEYCVNECGCGMTQQMVTDAHWNMDDEWILKVLPCLSLEGSCAVWQYLGHSGLSEINVELGQAWYAKSESPGMFDPEGASGERNIHAWSTLIILSSASAKGRAGGGYDLEREDGKSTSAC